MKWFRRFRKTDDFRFLDYGTGDGHFFSALSSGDIAGCHLVAYEPIENQFIQLMEKIETENLPVEATKELPVSDNQFDMILCAEVLEHFSAENTLKMLGEIKRLLRQGGRLVISVPIETGLAGAAKNIVRLSIGQSHSGLTARNFFRSILGQPFFRGSDTYISSHVGFSHKRLEYLIIESGFDIFEKTYSPFPMFKSALNSQAFFICKKRS